MKTRTHKLPLAVVLQREIQSREKIQLVPDQFTQIDLGSAGVVNSIVVKGFPTLGGRVAFEKSGSHGKIGVSFPSLKSHPEEQRIWNHALRLASSKLGTQLVKNSEGLWVQRLWLPLHRDGDVALQFVLTATMPVIEEARRVLRTLAEAALE